jgi:RHS repeat-associated protein
LLAHIMNRGDRRERISLDDADSSASSTRRTTFRYDGKRRRRVTREETKGSSRQWVLASETRYVYDGMRVIQERNGNGVPTVAYTRGPDLSGTLEGAGGIGGLLARSEWNSVSSAWSEHAFYHSDGVGNVTALAVPSGGDIALAGSYRYDPFGRLIGTPTGLAARNTQRFSSKEWHNASGFYAFGYRFYDPATQRWLNRDPIGEEGGVNLYGYVENDPINFIDPLGLSSIQAQVLVAIAKGDLVALESLLATGMLSPAAAARVQEAINRLNSPAVQNGLDKVCKVARMAARPNDNILVQFGRNANQIQHAFRHTDALGLDRAAVQTGVQNHFNTVASQITIGRPFIQFVDVAGQRIQYTAFRLQDGTVNVGRIHAAP